MRCIALGGLRSVGRLSLRFDQLACLAKLVFDLFVLNGLLFKDF